MTHGACLLVAVVILAQAEPEVTTRGHLRGNGATVTIVSSPQASQEGCEEAVKQVKEAFASQTQCHPSKFNLVSCSWEMSRGIKYFAKVDVQPCGLHGFAHLRIHKSAGEDVPATLKDVALDVDRDTPLA